jgi:hypothetical protein
MTESMPSSIQPNQAAQKPTICCRLRGVREWMDVGAGVMPAAEPWGIFISFARTCLVTIDAPNQPTERLPLVGRSRSAGTCAWMLAAPAKKAAVE